VVEKGSAETRPAECLGGGLGGGANPRLAEETNSVSQGLAGQLSEKDAPVTSRRGSAKLPAKTFNSARDIATASKDRGSAGKPGHRILRSGNAGITLSEALSQRIGGPSLSAAERKSIVLRTWGRDVYRSGKHS
jgi:hypothetical protein